MAIADHTFEETHCDKCGCLLNPDIDGTDSYSCKDCLDKIEELEERIDKLEEQKYDIEEEIEKLNEELEALK